MSEEDTTKKHVTPIGDAPFMRPGAPPSPGDLERARQRRRGRIEDIDLTLAPQPSMEEWLSEGLKKHCHYVEDVEALSHFIFHPRLNGESNQCLICGYGVMTEEPIGIHMGHAKDCAVEVTLYKLIGKQTLKEWSSRGELELLARLRRGEDTCED